MPNRCCVPGCKSNSFKLQAKVDVFSFPEDENLCKQWVAAIPREDFNPTQHSRVCLLHFANEDIIRILTTTDAISKKTISIRLKFPKLRPGSIPTILPTFKVNTSIRKEQMNIDTLICLVKYREPIWDVKNQQYNNRSVNDKMWADVADEMGVSVCEVKLQWKSLRYRYRGLINTTFKRSEQVWKWYDSLSFLKEVINSPNVRKNWDYFSDSTNDLVELDEMTPDITGLPTIYHKGQKRKFTDTSNEDSDEETQLESHLYSDASTPPVNCTIPEETSVRTSQVVDTAKSTDIFVQNTEYCNIDSTNNPDYLDETKPDIINLPPLDNTGQTYSDEPDGIDVKEESSQLDMCDTYWFLMSIRKAMKSLPLNRQFYLRCKMQHLIYDELEKINSS